MPLSFLPHQSLAQVGHSPWLLSAWLRQHGIRCRLLLDHQRFYLEIVSC